jgi:hypothetical protein
MRILSEEESSDLKSHIKALRKLKPILSPFIWYCMVHVIIYAEEALKDDKKARKKTGLGV